MKIINFDHTAAMEQEALSLLAGQAVQGASRVELWFSKGPENVENGGSR